MWCEWGSDTRTFFFYNLIYIDDFNDYLRDIKGLQTVFYVYVRNFVCFFPTFTNQSKMEKLCMRVFVWQKMQWEFRVFMLVFLLLRHFWNEMLKSQTEQFKIEEDKMIKIPVARAKVLV